MEKQANSSRSDNSDSERNESEFGTAIIDKEAQTIALEPSTSVEPVPDGGLEAWLIVLGATIVLVDTWGLINTFGVFQAYYEETLLKTSSASDISWIGSIQAALLCLVGLISGPLFDAGYFRHTLVGGLFLIIFGMFMTSLCTVYWQFVLAQGICVGLGMGLTFLPSAAIISQYFSRHRALALGISSAGSPVAGIVFPIIFSRLEPVVGFGWATRVLAFILLALSVIPLVCMRTRIPPSGKARALFDRSALTDWPYVTFVASSFFSFLTLYVPFFYITVFATAHKITTPDFAPYLVTMLNVGSVFGRLVPNALADRYGSLNVLSICLIGSAAIGYGWLGIQNLAGAIVFALLYGALSGGVVSLVPSVIVSLAPDMSRVGVRMGISFLVSGIALLIGTPIAGAIVGGYSDAEWKGTMAYAASGLLFAAVLNTVARVMVYKKRGGWRA
ncbi:major facilitator superfamily domain-containing protein [Lasiosphaeris hirsuta]|uniref:Major facilitator superfamily domain-containing protein n=1 Tax=Lasiosphaeris hirsuta TaxID=260670 RepID=A0AA40BAV0_9PEZI|nr:major facilitator superfamily domain-containing protein [Lasiosphaeris hirsuta]